MEEKKTNMEKWQEVEERNLDRALEAEPGSEEEKMALKQASDIHDIINENSKRENEKKETRRRMIWDSVKFVLGGIGCFAAKVYFTSREEQYEDAKIDKIMSWEDEGKMPTHTPSKKIFDNAFRRK